jgi:ribosomal protein L5
MSITDFKLDKKDLVGQKIEVTGSLALFGGMATLSDPDQPFDTSPVIVSIEELPRADREFMLQSRCTPGCRVTVRGEVAMIMFQPGLNIEALVR